MTELNDELRHLLQRKSVEVPPQRSVPPSLIRRVRRRIALNVLALGTAVAVLAGGGLVGVRALDAAPTIEPAGPPAHPSLQPPSHPKQHVVHPAPSVAPTTSTSPAPSTSPSVSPAATAASCGSGQLRATAMMQGAAGSLVGVIDIANFSSTRCTLQGRPALTLLDQNLRPITTGIAFTRAPAGWVVDGSPRPSGWPVVTLRPGDAASVRIQWTNWCRSGRAPLWRVGIPGSGAVDVIAGLDSVSPPPCNGPGQPSTIAVGPFEPGPRR